MECHNPNGNHGTRQSPEERVEGKSETPAWVSMCEIDPSVIKKIKLSKEEIFWKRGNPGHFYQFADSCLLRNKLDQTAKEKLVITRILTVCHKNAQESASILLSLSLPTENTKQRHTPKCLSPVWPMKKLCLMLLQILHWRKGRKHCLNYPVSCFSCSLPYALETWPSSEYIANRV